MGRFIIVDDKHKEDGYRREEMRQRMSGYRNYGGYRMGDFRHHPEREYDEGYRQGYEHGYKDHEEDMMSGEGYRRTRYGM